MNQFIKFTGYFLTFLMLAGSFSVHAGCKQPDRGPPGPQGPQGPSGPSFVTTFAAWYIPGTDGITVIPGDVIPFNTEEISSGITNSLGTFTFSRSGVYQVTVGYAPQEAGDILDIELNGVLVPGGRIEPPSSSSNVVTVIFSAAAGDQLSVVNSTTPPTTITIGTGTSISSGIYISILQIQ